MAREHLMAGPKFAWNAFAAPGELASALAATVADRLRDAIDRQGEALVAVSGGTTPALFFRTMSDAELDWSKLTVILVDERFVPMSSPRSNAALVAENLLQNRASAARFVGLYRPVDTVEEAAAQAGKELSALSWPLDVALLGMGLDGHTASFFPGAGNLEALLDPATESTVMPVHAPSAGEPRLTLPLAKLTSAGFVALQIEGNEKRGVFETAIAPGCTMPVRAVLDHARTPVEVFWAP
jgi:6-phosphogluconolactonase